MYSNYTDNLSKITAYSSKISNRIINIISNIKKLTGGKIKKYKIENKLELEIICNYLLTYNILHTLSITQILNIELFNGLYEDYKKNENNYDLCFMWIKDDYEYNRIRKNYTFYIQVIKDCKNIT